jgi:predicted HAD superfamily hydrolase
MYLPKEFIEKVLAKNGYTGYSRLYLSSDTFTTKSTGKMYEQVVKELKIEPSEMVHIGDNYESDICVPKNLGINSMWLPRTVNVMIDSKLTNHLTSMYLDKFPFWNDNEAGIEFIGIRSMIAVCANKYFDNPFRTFNKETDFNADPYLIGYYAMGMYMFSVTKWLLENTKNKDYKNLVFMARDGYLPMEAYKIMKKGSKEYLNDISCN